MTSNPARPSSEGIRPSRRRSLATSLVLTAAAVLVTPVAATATGVTTGGGGEVDVAAVDRFLTTQLEAASIPGAAVAITHGNRVIHVAGFGHDSTGAPVTADTPFRIASLSKSFTALAVLQLVDEGRVSLDDRVNAHLPDFRLADPRGASITVRQLLDQTSGMADSVARDSDRHPATLADAVAGLRNNGLAAAPGAQWNYHNPNYQVAARLVEVVSGQPFDSYLRTQVFEPTGMTSSRTVDTDDQPVPGLADGHIVAYGHAFPLPGPHTFDGGDGGVVSTAADMANWLVVQTNGSAPDGTRIISDRSLTQMQTPSSNATAHGYALGWDTAGPADAPTRIEHTGNLLTYTAYQAVMPDTGYGVAILLNSGSGLMLDETGIFYGIRDIIEGTDLTPSGPAYTTYSATTLDTVLAILTLGLLLLGVRGVLGARRWVSRHGHSRTRVVLRTIPHLAVLVAVALFPRLAGQLVGGRTVTWETAAYGWAALTVLVLTTLVTTVATLTARAGHLTLRSRHRATPAAASTAATPAWTPTCRSGATKN